jgi:hypothetical protein
MNQEDLPRCGKERGGSLAHAHFAELGLISLGWPESKRADLSDETRFARCYAHK